MIGDILQERGEYYGIFTGQAEISQGLKRIIAAKAHNLADDQREALEMIAHKIARILNGDADYEDSWVDIAGYATLVSTRLYQEKLEF